MGTEGDGTPSVWLSADDENTSISSQGYFGFEIDGCSVDATVALYRDVESVATLIGGESGVLDIKELRADLQRAFGSFATVNPCGSTVGDFERGGKMVVGHGESNHVHDIPQFGVIGGGENHLKALDSGTRCPSHRVNRLFTVEESELVALLERVVVFDDGLRELRHGSIGIDRKIPECYAADEDIGGVLRHLDAGEAAARDLIRCEDGSAVETDGLGNINLDHVDVGLDEGVEDGHLRRQVLIALAKHRVELFVDGGEVGSLGTAVHLFRRTARHDWFDRQFADYGATTGLSVEILSDLAADFCVYSKEFCHCVFPFFFLLDIFVYSSSWRGSACAPTGVASKDDAKVRGCQKTESGIVSFRWALSVHYGCIRGGIVGIRRWAEVGKKGK